MAPPVSVAEAVQILDDERAARAKAADALAADLAERIQKVPVVRLPFVEATARVGNPRAIAGGIQPSRRARVATKWRWRGVRVGNPRAIAGGIQVRVMLGFLIHPKARDLARELGIHIVAMRAAA